MHIQSELGADSSEEDDNATSGDRGGLRSSFHIPCDQNITGVRGDLAWLIGEVKQGESWTDSGPRIRAAEAIEGLCAHDVARAKALSDELINQVRCQGIVDDTVVRMEMAGGLAALLTKEYSTAIERLEWSLRIAAFLSPEMLLSSHPSFPSLLQALFAQQDRQKATSLLCEAIAQLRAVIPTAQGTERSPLLSKIGELESHRVGLEAALSLQHPAAGVFSVASQVDATAGQMAEWFVLSARRRASRTELGSIVAMYVPFPVLSETHASPTELRTIRINARIYNCEMFAGEGRTRTDRYVRYRGACWSGVIPAMAPKNLARIAKNAYTEMQISPVRDVLLAVDGGPCGGLLGLCWTPGGVVFASLWRDGDQCGEIPHRLPPQRVKQFFNLVTLMLTAGSPDSAQGYLDGALSVLKRSGAAGNTLSRVVFESDSAPSGSELIKALPGRSADFKERAIRRLEFFRKLPLLQSGHPVSTAAAH